MIGYLVMMFGLGIAFVLTRVEWEETDFWIRQHAPRWVEKLIRPTIVMFSIPVVLAGYVIMYLELQGDVRFVSILLGVIAFVIFAHAWRGSFNFEIWSRVVSVIAIAIIVCTVYVLFDNSNVSNMNTASFGLGIILGIVSYVIAFILFGIGKMFTGTTRATISAPGIVGKRIGTLLVIFVVLSFFASGLGVDIFAVISNFASGAGNAIREFGENFEENGVEFFSQFEDTSCQTTLRSNVNVYAFNNDRVLVEEVDITFNIAVTVDPEKVMYIPEGGFVHIETFDVAGPAGTELYALIDFLPFGFMDECAP